MNNTFAVGSRVYPVYHAGSTRRVQGEYIVVKSGKRDVKISRVSDGYERTFNKITGYEKGDRFNRTTLVSSDVASHITAYEQQVQATNELWVKVQQAAKMKDKSEVERLLQLLPKP